jgi:hypothetical protein
MDNLFDEITDGELLLYANDLQLDGNDEFFNYNIDKKDDSEDNELQHNIEECQTKHLLKVSFSYLSFSDFFLYISFLLLSDIRRKNFITKNGSIIDECNR